MSIEKAFAIHAAPAAIFAAIERDLASAVEAGSESFSVLRRDPDRSLDLQVTIGGVPCWLRYDLIPSADHTEVVARLTPFGLKYTLFRIMTFGFRDQGLALVLVQGLSNLKAELERPHAAEDDDGPE